MPLKVINDRFYDKHSMDCAIELVQNGASFRKGSLMKHVRTFFIDIHERFLSLFDYYKIYSILYKHSNINMRW